MNARINARIVTGPAPGTTSTSARPVTGPAPGSDASNNATAKAAGATGEAVKRNGKQQGTADLNVAAVFSHHMVLQRHRPIPVFGHGKPGTQVRVRLFDAVSATPDGGEATSGNGMAASDNGKATDDTGTTTDGETALSIKADTTPIATADPMASSDTGVTPLAETSGKILPDGSWRILLPPQEAGGPYTLEIDNLTDSRLVFHDVMIGEVWLASGQSNMEFELHSTREAAQAVAQSADPMLRFYNTPKSGDVSDDLLEAERESSWQACSPDTSGTMSAVAYYFAARLRRQFGAAMPIGIIDCYIGGTSITCWMDQQTVESSDAGRPYWQRYQQALAGHTEQDFRGMTLAWKTKFDRWNAQIEAARTANPNVSWDELNAAYGECPWPPPVTPHSQYRPTGAFTAMVARIAPYAVRGVLWYQGEEDAPYSASYAVLLRQMIALWRRIWRIGTGDGETRCDAGTQSGRCEQGAGQCAGRDAECDTEHAECSTEHAEPGGEHDSSAVTAANTASAACAARPKYAAHCAELPFIIIQLPQWIDRATAEAHADPLDWPVIRDAQWSASREIPSVATVCTIDCGEFDNIHPYDKRTVGERTAAMALGTMYGCRQIAVWGPEPLTIRAIDGSADDSAGYSAGGGDGSDDSERGEAVLVRYRHAAGLRFDGTVPGTTNADGLDAVSRSAEQSGFELAGADGVFHDAAARIVPDCAVNGGKTSLFSEPGTTGNKAAGSAASDTTSDTTSDTAHDTTHSTTGEGGCAIRVFSPDVPQPVAIRYAWKSWGPAPVRNADGLPGIPFRADVPQA